MKSYAKSRMEEWFEKALISLRNLDPRIKLFLAMFCLFLVLASKAAPFPLGVFFISFGVLCVLLKRPKLILHRFEEPLFIVAVLVFLKALGKEGEEVISFSVPWWGLKIGLHERGLLDGLLIGLRVLASVSLISLLREVMPFFQFLSALSWYRLPRELVEILLLADRFMFYLLEEAKVIYISQKNRLGYLGLKRRFSSFAQLVGSLLLKIFDQSERTTLSMSLRGYDGHIPLVGLPKPTGKQLLLSFASMIFLLGVWAL